MVITNLPGSGEGYLRGGPRPRRGRPCCTASIEPVKRSSCYRHSAAIPTIWPLHRQDSGLERVAKANGFSLHAGVSCEGHQKDKRERLCSALHAKRGMSLPRCLESKINLQKLASQRPLLAKAALSLVCEIDHQVLIPRVSDMTAHRKRETLDVVGQPNSPRMSYSFCRLDPSSLATILCIVAREFYRMSSSSHGPLQRFSATPVA